MNYITQGKYGWVGIAIVFIAIMLRVANQFRPGLQIFKKNLEKQIKVKQI